MVSGGDGFAGPLDGGVIVERPLFGDLQLQDCLFFRDVYGGH